MGRPDDSLSISTTGQAGLPGPPAASSLALGPQKTQNLKEEEKSVERPGSSAQANDSGAGGRQGACARCEFRNLDGSRCTEFAEYEVPVWDLQPVPGIAPQGAPQTGNSWCLRHAICALTSVYQGPRAQADLDTWNAKYEKAYRLLQVRANEVQARREARQECTEWLYRAMGAAPEKPQSLS